MSTVSLVVNGKDDRIGDATRQRVRQAVAQLGYRADPLARSLRSGGRAVLGLVTDAVAGTAVAGGIVRGALQTARAAHHTLLMGETGGDPAAAEDVIAALAGLRPAGIIVASWFHHVASAAEIAPFASAGIPTVYVNLELPEPGSSAPVFVPDEEGGARLAAESLIAQGHRRIALIGADERGPAPAGRTRGHLAALAAAGLRADDAPIILVPPETAGGRDAALQLLRRSPRPSAVCCYNDRVAMGVLQGCAEQGVRVPEDLAVVGFDDQEAIAPHLQPALTTIALPHEQLGAHAASALLGQHPLPVGLQHVACTLVRRESARV